MSDTATADYNPATGEIIEPEEQDSAPASAGALVIQDAITRLQSGRTNVYSTVVGDDFEAKMKVMSAVSSATPIMEHIDKHIDLENIVVQAVELDAQDANGRPTGEKVWQPRVILLDANGTAYYGISPVLFRAIETFTGVLGQPHTWPEPVGVKVLREKAKRGFFFNLILDPTKAAAKK